MHYILSRSLIIIPTLLCIIVINFTLMNFLPGSPMDYLMSQYMSGANNLENSNIEQNGQNFQKKIIEEYELERSFGTKLKTVLINYIKLDFGTSIKYNKKVGTIILERLTNSFIIGTISTIFLYIIGIYLGFIYCTTKNNFIKNFIDCITSFGYSIPNFILCIILIIVLSSGNYFFAIFPMQNLHAINWNQMNWLKKIQDYIWHITLPIITIILGNCGYYFIFIKNRILNEQNKLYYKMAISKGLTKRQAIKNHLLKNASLTLIASIPVHISYCVFSGTLFFIEIAFSINGIGMLGYEAILNRDYPVITGVIFTYSAAMLISRLLNDILHMIIDPRVSYESH